jgi:hypothetical protein
MAPRKKSETEELEIPEAEPVGDIDTADPGPAARPYTVTQLAGPRVAGRRSPGPGETIELTEAEAATELLAGALEVKA